MVLQRWCSGAEVRWMMWLTIAAESIGHRKAEGSRKQDDRLESQVGREQGLAGWLAGQSWCAMG